ncbi:hypothetical protein KI811_12650 [Geobacter hydrogenophilus]|uniref:hypothetical protein n=1 Tax=Geobacter hydrogenophilus TaxID=40983 RepID=UPI001BDAEB61|nr:hypothetical protein [Geobacter hydrogenophilus]MBT0894660.1 hypothetical protein [Geobacter hydrogenophilus]
MPPTDPPRKHPCTDCRFCQWCGDDRCSLCLGGRKRGKKLSLAEQIELFEKVNRGETGGCSGCNER